MQVLNRLDRRNRLVPACLGNQRNIKPLALITFGRAEIDNAVIVANGMGMFRQVIVCGCNVAAGELHHSDFIENKKSLHNALAWSLSATTLSRAHLAEYRRFPNYM